MSTKSREERSAAAKAPPPQDLPLGADRGANQDTRESERASRERAAQVQDTLDDALADSFPASDPVAIVTSQHEEAWDEQR